MDTATHEALEEVLWVQRCRLGDPQGFIHIYERYRGPILYYVRKMLDDPEAADDASQETWIKVYRGLRKLRDSGRLRPWLYRIARNEVLQAFRRRSREPEPASDLDDVPADEPDEPYRPEEAEAVNRALARLPVIQREVLVLYFLHEMSYEEIAEAVDCGIGTVRSRLHYGKKALRRELEVEVHGTRE